MPSILTHPAVAGALAPWFDRAKLSKATVVAGALCTVVPDLDTLGMRAGIPYSSPLGHRGLSHSIIFAVALAGLAHLILRRLQGTSAGVSALAFLLLCSLSHGFLDAFTNGGLGVGFFIPFSSERFFFPWRPIEVSPLSVRGFLSARGWVVLQSEIAWVVLSSAILGALGCVVRRRTNGLRP
jgi:inner membrane protein